MRKIIQEWMDNFKETGSDLKCTSMGRLSVLVERVEEVQEAHECSSGRFVYTTARQP
jgi:hypothetical protein